MCKSDDIKTESSSTSMGTSQPSSLPGSSGGVPPLRKCSTVSKTASTISTNSDDDESNGSPTPTRAEDDDYYSEESSSDSDATQKRSKDHKGFGFEKYDPNGIRTTGRTSSSVSTNSTVSDTTTTTSGSSNSVLHSISWIVAGIGAAYGMTVFSLWFPFFLAPHAATKTYHWAYYHYDPSKSHFDNTIWTYGTDYGLGVVTATLAYILVKTGYGTVAQGLSLRAASLQILYCISVLAGGYAHQNFLTLESRNTIEFRILWTICVGSVCAASISMGMCGSRALQQFKHIHTRDEQQRSGLSSPSPSLLHYLPEAPDVFWIVFGCIETVLCAYGLMSFQRPACDIFIAGITQSFPTFYIMAYFALLQHGQVSKTLKVVGVVGFILNAQLLPAYPLLVQYTDLSLASVNTLLHSNLCAAWTMQGLSTLQLCKVLIADNEQQRQQQQTVVGKKED